LGRGGGGWGRGTRRVLSPRALRPPNPCFLPDPAPLSLRPCAPAPPPADEAVQAERAAISALAAQSGGSLCRALLSAMSRLAAVENRRAKAWMDAQLAAAASASPASGGGERLTAAATSSPLCCHASPAALWALSLLVGPEASEVRDEWGLGGLIGRVDGAGGLGGWIGRVDWAGGLDRGGGGTVCVCVCVCVPAWV
jgi:hypothetical protein